MEGPMSVTVSISAPVELPPPLRGTLHTVSGAGRTVLVVRTATRGAHSFEIPPQLPRPKPAPAPRPRPRKK